VEGALRHDTLGEKAEALPPADAAGDERIHARSVSLSSERYGLTAVIDLVEGEGGRVSPVDYKHGAPREQDDVLEAWPTDRAQVCVQALILREHGYTCDEAVATRVRPPICPSRFRVDVDAAPFEAIMSVVRFSRLADSALIEARPH
jgi:CRISPR/Cas system-associated exonuclease Cas4 (RecB family)